MNLEEYKQYVESVRLTNLAIAMDALRKSRQIQIERGEIPNE
jgi:hypothetical protein